jgi:hypothetical protein
VWGGSALGPLFVSYQQAYGGGHSLSAYFVVAVVVFLLLFFTLKFLPCFVSMMLFLWVWNPVLHLC